MKAFSRLPPRPRPLIAALDCDCIDLLLAATIHRIGQCAKCHTQRAGCRHLEVNAIRIGAKPSRRNSEESAKSQKKMDLSWSGRTTKRHKKQDRATADRRPTPNLTRMPIRGEAGPWEPNVTQDHANAPRLTCGRVNRRLSCAPSVTSRLSAPSLVPEYRASAGPEDLSLQERQATTLGNDNVGYETITQVGQYQGG